MIRPSKIYCSPVILEIPLDANIVLLQGSIPKKSYYNLSDSEKIEYFQQAYPGIYNNLIKRKAAIKEILDLADYSYTVQNCAEHHIDQVIYDSGIQKKRKNKFLNKLKKK